MLEPMNDLTLVILFSLLGGIVSLFGGLVLLSREGSAKKFAKYATPFAAGALLAAIFIDLLPEAVEEADANAVLMAALAGFVAFFLLQRLLHWFHHHSHDEHKISLTNPKVGLIVLGDTLHNALDGVAIAAAFLINVPTGIVTTLAVAAHEIPQEIGDMGLLLARGVSKKKVIIVNVLSALATTVTAVVVFMLGDSDALPIGILLGVAAGFLLYIAASDVIPGLHQEAGKRRVFDWQALLLLAGIVVVGLAVNLSHRYIDDGHSHETTESSHQDEAGHEPGECSFSSGNYQANTCSDHEAE